MERWVGALHFFASHSCANVVFSQRAGASVLAQVISTGQRNEIFEILRGKDRD